MKQMLIILILACTLPLLVHAQALTTKGRTGLDERQPQMQQAPLAPPAQQVAPSGTPAGTPMSDEQANNFYHNCVSNPDPRMTTETQDAMCACNAVMMQQSMSVEEVQLMVSDALESRGALNKMLLNVYAPCMNYPVNDLVLAECLRDENVNTAGMGISKDILCGCMAEQTATWFTREGRSLMAEILAKNPTIFDPITPVMESNTFKSATMNALTQCMQSL